ncbi:hypothetical protein MPSEU_000467300 [Mayamaea pseudoterrestris]|nr:hypothetical protein MPSEU_000467300 [Mayamaea pseudoterrestris]
MEAINQVESDDESTESDDESTDTEFDENQLMAVPARAPQMQEPLPQQISRFRKSLKIPIVTVGQLHDPNQEWGIICRIDISTRHFVALALFPELRSSCLQRERQRLAAAAAAAASRVLKVYAQISLGGLPTITTELARANIEADYDGSAAAIRDFFAEIYTWITSLHLCGLPPSFLGAVSSMCSPMSAITYLSVESKGQTYVDEDLLVLQEFFRPYLALSGVTLEIIDGDLLSIFCTALSALPRLSDCFVSGNYNRTAPLINVTSQADAQTLRQLLEGQSLRNLALRCVKVTTEIASDIICRGIMASRAENINLGNYLHIAMNKTDENVAGTVGQSEIYLLTIENFDDSTPNEDMLVESVCRAFSDGQLIRHLEIDSENMGSGQLSTALTQGCRWKVRTLNLALSIWNIAIESELVAFLRSQKATLRKLTLQFCDGSPRKVEAIASDSLLDVFGATDSSLTDILFEDGYSPEMPARQFKLEWRNQVTHVVAVNRARVRLRSLLPQSPFGEEDTSRMLRLVLLAPWINVGILYELLRNNDCDLQAVLRRAILPGPSDLLTDAHLDVDGDVGAAMAAACVANYDVVSSDLSTAEVELAPPAASTAIDEYLAVEAAIVDTTGLADNDDEMGAL